MGLVEDPGHFDTQADEGGDGEEAAVVELCGLVLPEDGLPVLTIEQRTDVRIVDPLERAGCEREDVVVQPDRAEGRSFRGCPVDGDVPLGDHLRELRPQDRQSHPPAAEIPVDVERLGVARVPTAGEHVPPPVVLRGLRGAHVVGHDVDDDAESAARAAAAKRSRAAGPPRAGSTREESTTS